ncbi:hypothetical protein CPT_Stills5 [Bacillus phage Stills]|uniref:Uncharacterized protein n=1 Tax=Bacillus phage Stills TaxID=1610833 RepID=A0A0E3X9K8_9CAUD|nr:hypothetical protein CPT_Stills5 [Bacillus phage Stills]AKC02633.1 hypothetical protein CPT_Stills5 [Bacillus phage Stills]
MRMIENLEPQESYLIGNGNMLKIFVIPMTGARLFVVYDPYGEIKAVTSQ